MESEEQFWARARQRGRIIRNLLFAVAALILILLYGAYGPAITFG